MLPPATDTRDKGDKGDIFDNKNNFVADVADVAATGGNGNGHVVEHDDEPEPGSFEPEEPFDLPDLPAFLDRRARA